MKYLILLSLLLTGCSNPKIGECYGTLHGLVKIKETYEHGALIDGVEDRYGDIITYTRYVRYAAFNENYVTVDCITYDMALLKVKK